MKSDRKLYKGTIALLIVVGLFVFEFLQNEEETTILPTETTEQFHNAKQAFDNSLSNIQVLDRGRVVKILPDDLKGSRHQRFIVKVAPDLTVLIAHNIDLAPRIDSLKRGDSVQIFGEYEWNKKGGVIHWTHIDPRGKHLDGWIEHKGVYYK